jgi:uncharacterized protein YqeY
MSLLQQIESELKNAMKEGNEAKTRTLKMLKSDITYEKAKTGDDISDETILEVIARAGKKRKEAIEEYTKAGREELAAAEKEELEIISAYLPEQMSEDEISAALDAIISETGAESKKDFGRVMGQAMQQLKGKADGGLVKKLLTEKLS